RGVEIVACADTDERAARAAADAHAVPHVYRDFRELLRREDIDAVDVCLHNNLHMPVAVAALQSGKHVYSEKPIAGSYRDALTMVDTARRCDRMLHVQLFLLF